MSSTYFGAHCANVRESSYNVSKPLLILRLSYRSLNITNVGGGLQSYLHLLKRYCLVVMA